MKCRIHRGADEIGGGCYELEAHGKRLVLDVGWPISAAPGEDVPLPEVSGLADGTDPTLLGVCITHAHPDHYGLMEKAWPSVPVFIGAAAARILSEATFYSPGGLQLKPHAQFEHRNPLTIGPFTVTPYLNDHSAYDAYSLLVEAGGRRLFYTGDIRAHGRKALLFEELLRDPPIGVDALLMEGTNVRADATGEERGPSERDVEDAGVKTFEATQVMVLAMFSPQNIDRLVTMFRACRRSGRGLVIDLYAASIARATGRDTIPQADWDGVRVYLPKSQRSKIIREKAFERTNEVKAHRIYPEELAMRRGELVMLFRASMMRELDQPDILDQAQVVWSMWPGYLENDSGQRFKDWLKTLSIPLVVHHSSGHAYVPDLQRLVDALAPARVVPIHSFAGDRFEEFFARVERRADGEWWDV
ncbi:MBL fold metallo-hydrolase [Gammaproteobacteria bacterium]|nr:MBL fold metallo-hydrolase [Gammaproteobacteria bacterium]